MWFSLFKYVSMKNIYDTNDISKFEIQINKEKLWTYMLFMALMIITEFVEHISLHGVRFNVLCIKKLQTDS